MDRLVKMQGLVRRIFAILATILVGIFIGFIFHMIQVNKFNNLDREITADSVTMEVTADIHPRGLITDSWEKNDAFPDKVINAKIYEATITNNSKCVMTDWSLRINIHEDCYVNNAWNGVVEIHQFTDKERVQTLDLRNYNAEDIILDYYLAGQDLLIPLKNGDYIVYYPDTSSSSSEVPLKSTAEYSGQTNIGIIMYSLSGNVDLSDFTMQYHIHKSYFADLTGKIYLVLLPTWLLIMLVGGLIAWIILGFEGQLIVQRQMLDDTFNLCAVVADAKDYYHREHSKNVAKYSRFIAEHMGMDKSDCDAIYYSALLHNIGNYSVPESILGKATQLTDEEKKIVRMHTVKGAYLLETINSIPHAAEAAMFHHERYDGTGYPVGKKGDEIPLIARIIAVADAYDNMNREKLYRKKFTKSEIIEEFKNNAGTQFDPMIVDVFLSIINEIEE
ncbi:HD-GYP domain-containing protein [Pseudobutyrivibrio sp.]|uniref:HD-GYP domain-containing protein n=1 Tax=Pseudobutyrivibrio sp. TaxID=2014367 RepID=UPI001B2B8D60|nr:HD-GYP domain-containing protein [Pseudobutyrivibrio sp.]MBO5617261.1 HD-GYP domain-containing protein [Pseudobutyrivibrio sp.]MBP3262200.1 HD-GYP domain-containing protein [Pseudobutyrivibrio sp.]